MNYSSKLDTSLDRRLVLLKICPPPSNPPEENHWEVALRNVLYNTIPELLPTSFPDLNEVLGLPPIFSAIREGILLQRSFWHKSKLRWPRTRSIPGQ